ncbi:MAG: hypothetical protein CL946_00715 [Ectothiorhodospiraceae bacterium]|nr:hypothetical protein [Ectothiorhodospiraceae bacterium]
MTVAYRVSYSGPNGECPDCVIPLDGSVGDCVTEQAAVIKRTLVCSGGLDWEEDDVVIRKIEYIGPVVCPPRPSPLETIG